MTQVGGVTFASSDGENLSEMQALRRAHHVPNRIGFQFVDAIIDGGEIGRGIIEAAIPLTNDQGLIREFWIVAEENYYRSFADLGYASLEQPVYHAG